MKRSYRFIFTVAILLLSTLCYAQSPDIIWTKEIGVPEFSEIANDFEITNDGGFVLAGWTRIPHGVADVFNYIARLDMNGDTLWTMDYGLLSWQKAVKILETDSNEFIILGNQRETSDSPWEIVLTKMDFDGEYLWSSSLEDEYSNDASDFILTANNEIVVAGTAFDVQLQRYYMLLSKFDDHGVHLWTRTFISMFNTYGNAIEETSDGGFIISGTTRPWAPNISGLFILRTDSEGDSLWSRTFDESLNVDYKLGSMTKTHDNCYLILGQRFIQPGDDMPLQLLKIDTIGDTVWTNEIEVYYQRYDRPYSITSTSDDGFIISGMGRFNEEFEQDKKLVIKADSLGDTLWTKAMEVDHYNERLFITKEYDTNQYIMMGYTEVNDDHLDIRMTKLGNEISVHEQDLRIPQEFEISSIYPNPFNPSTSINISLPASSILKIRVFDLIGREVSLITDDQYSQGTHTITFDGSNLSSGIYFVNAKVDGKMDITNKVILLR